MRQYILPKFLSLVLLLSIFSCQQEPGPEQSLADTAIVHSNHVHLSTEQQELAGIKTGPAVQQPIADHIGCTAYVDVPPYSRASVYTPIAGIVQEVRQIPGEFVKKGTILTRIQHPNIITLQQDYMECYSQVSFLRQDAERKKTLAAEEATSTRSAEEAAATQAQQEARLKGLQARLKLLGINTNSLTEGGEIETSITLRAPISGYLTEVNINKGQLVSPPDLLYAIIDNNHKHLELSVFAKDLPLIKEQQRIEAYIPGSKQFYEANVHLIGKQVEANSKSIQIHGHFKNEPQDLLPGTYLQAKIFTNEKMAWTVPETAIIRQGQETFVYVEDEEGFFPLAVEVAETRDGFVIIQNPERIEGKTLVLDGAYYLQDGLAAGHSH